MDVPLLDLRLQYQSLRQEIRNAVEDVMSGQHFIMGPQVSEFEKAIAAYAKVSHAIACASGSDALILALMASDLKAGDGVITVPFTFFATVGAITRLGAHPFLVDIEAETYNLSPHELRRFLEESCERRNGLTIHRSSGRRIHSVIPVHLYGQCADMDAILKIAKQWNLMVIEDAAQALGARYKERPAGSMGDMGCYSFFPSKNLGAAGDAGMVVTQNAELAEKLRVLRIHGSKPKYFHKVVGLNSRLDTLQAAILLIKFAHLDAWSEGRRANARFYDEAMRDLAPGISTPRVAAVHFMVYNQYCIRSGRRDALRQFLQNRGIGTEIYYPLPLHLQECFQHLGYHKGDFPESEKASLEILALPIYPELTSEQKRYVVESLRAFAKEKQPV